MDTRIFETYESEVRSYCRNMPAVFARAKGSFLYDEDGAEYIDFFCGAGAENYGHNNDYIKAKVLDYLQNDGFMHALDMYTTAKRNFLTTLEERILKPRGLDYKVQFPGPTGTNAMEAALKLARKVKKRPDVWALMGCFHGMTLGTLALTTERGARAGAGVPLNNVYHVPAPYMFPELDTIQYMQTLLDDDHSGVEKPAALAIETVQAEGGIQVFSVEWLKAVEEFCHKNDILLIVDDVQTGCARTGTFFSFERAGIKPDIVAMSKSIGGYGFPFAITLMKPELDIWKPGEHNGTFRGNQMALVAANAGLEFMLDAGIEKQVQEKGAIADDFIRREILPLDSRLETRGLGLIRGIEFAAIDPALSLKVRRRAFSKHLVVEAAGREDSVVKIMPPLTIDEETLLRGLTVLKETIQEILEENK